MQTTVLKISGMSCQSCASHTKKALESVAGVESATVDLDAAEAVVRHGEAVDPGKLIEAVIEEGYEARLWT